MTFKKGFKNYLMALPIKNKIKGIEDPDKIMRIINQTNIETDSEELIEFYNNIKNHIENKLYSPTANFDIDKYTELRSNLTIIDEEFLKKYGNTILMYLNKPRNELDKEIRKMDKIYDFTSREERIKKTISINDKEKEIYIRDKRPIKDYDILLYLNETLSLINHFLSQNVDTYLTAFENEQTVYDNFFEHEEIIYALIKNNFEEKFEYLKNSDILLFKNIYDYYMNSLNKKILNIFKMIAQSSRFREKDPYEDYSNYSKAKCICMKLQKNKKLNRFRKN